LWDNIEKNWDFVWIFYALETLWRSILKKKSSPKKKKKKKDLKKNTFQFQFFCFFVQFFYRCFYSPSQRKAFPPRIALV
jgi:hypothetical protein